MGLFGGNYMKEGPGVSKDEPEKTGFFRFWDVLGRKFVKLIKLNLLYLITSIPYLLLLFFITTQTINFVELYDLTVLDEEAIKSVYQTDLWLRIFIVIMVVVFWGAGPFTPGYIYNIRNFAREEHTWIASDYFTKIKENWKQSLLMTVIDLAVMYMGTIGLRFYWLQGQDVLCMIMVAMIGLYSMMHTYVYQIMVTFKTTFVQTIKNALTMTVAKFPMNLLLTVIVGAASYLLFYNLTMIWLLLSLLILVALFSFILNFYPTSMIKKNFIDPYAEEKEEALFTDWN